MEINSKPADSYLASFSDANACVYVCPLGFEIEEGIAGETDATDVSCYGGTDGSATVFVSCGKLILQWQEKVKPSESKI